MSHCQSCLSDDEIVLFIVLLCETEMSGSTANQLDLHHLARQLVVFAAKEVDPLFSFTPEASRALADILLLRLNLHSQGSSQITSTQDEQTK
jgi:hypothetical protein